MASSAAASTPLSFALRDVRKLKVALRDNRARQIRSAELRAHLKAVANAWFGNYRLAITAPSETSLDAVNSAFKALLSSSEQSPSTAKLRVIVKGLEKNLVQLQTAVVAAPTHALGASDQPPSFAAIPDPYMRQVLQRRWGECVSCLAANAPLAATVMMGGLLESLFLARVNRESNKTAIFTAASAPKDPKTQKTFSLQNWTLTNYIAVAHELNWITQSERDVSDILRDYRNYIHPQKELTRQLALTGDDARMFWIVFKAIASRLI